MASVLPHGDLKRLEIARALATALDGIHAGCALARLHVSSEDQPDKEKEVAF